MKLTRKAARLVPSNSGSYAGSDSENTPIAHGLGRIPDFVYIVNGSTGGFAFISRALAAIRGSVGLYAVTAMDATNFYVGDAASYTDSANHTGETMYWVAF